MLSECQFSLHTKDVDFNAKNTAVLMFDIKLFCYFQGR